jgi:hypothetical protein
MRLWKTQDTHLVPSPLVGEGVSVVSVKLDWVRGQAAPPHPTEIVELLA